MQPLVAQIIMFGGNFAPRGWAFCDGQLLQIFQYQELFSVIGTIYGGDGRTTFALPDLRGRSAIGPRQGPGFSDFRIGQRGGTENAVLSVLNAPNHSHVATQVVPANAPADANLGPAQVAGRPVEFTSGQVVSAGGNTGPAGDSQPFSIRDPYLAVNFIIALEGIFPSRN